MPKLNGFNPIHWLSLGFGTGLAPKAPGTFGTLVGIPFVYLTTQLTWQWQLIILIAASLIGIFLCQYTAKAMGEHDHPSIVWDEIVGYGFAMLALPFELTWLIAAFILFRLFDIWKPGPIGWADKKLTGGTGIMMDDVLAGILTTAILHGIALIV